MRQTTNKSTNEINIEKSVIDFFIVCQKIYDLILTMNIDEERLYTLTKYASKKGKSKKVESDHNILSCKVNIEWKTNKIEKKREEKKYLILKVLKVRKRFLILKQILIL